jgi:hypothetical protein
MKTRKENQKNEKSKKFTLDKVEILKLDTMRKISGGGGGIGDDFTTTVSLRTLSTENCVN